MRGLDHAAILSPSFYDVHKERLAQWPAFCVLKNDQECTNHILFQTKMVEIDTLFQTKTAQKNISFGAAGTYFAYVRD